MIKCQFVSLVVFIRELIYGNAATQLEHRVPQQ
jgi:hypothetical protein